MLLPALNAAREQARTMSCINNQKQLGQVMLTYTVDRSYWIWPDRYLTDLPGNPGGVKRYWFGRLVMEGYIPNTSEKDLDNGFKLKDLKGRANFLHCPKTRFVSEVNDASFPSYLISSGTTDWGNANFTAVSGEENAARVVSHAVRPEKIKNPSAKIALSEKQSNAAHRARFRCNPGGLPGNPDSGGPDSDIGFPPWESRTDYEQQRLFLLCRRSLRSDKKENSLRRRKAWDGKGISVELV